jgi:hypothetical protein
MTAGGGPERPPPWRRLGTSPHSSSRLVNKITGYIPTETDHPNHELATLDVVSSAPSRRGKSVARFRALHKVAKPVRRTHVAVLEDNDA